MSHVKDTNGFLLKLKSLNKVSDNAILVTANVVGDYPSIPHNKGIEVLKKELDNFDKKSIYTEYSVKMAKLFSLK